MSTVENYTQHQLNFSKSKAAFLFPKEKRFNYRKRLYPFINLVSLKFSMIYQQQKINVRHPLDMVPKHLSSTNPNHLLREVIMSAVNSKSKNMEYPLEKEDSKSSSGLFWEDLSPKNIFPAPINIISLLSSQKLVEECQFGYQQNLMQSVKRKVQDQARMNQKE